MKIMNRQGKTRYGKKGIGRRAVHAGQSWLRFEIFAGWWEEDYLRQWITLHHPRPVQSFEVTPTGNNRSRRRGGRGGRWGTFAALL